MIAQQEASSPLLKRVIVLSYNNYSNFGDRLGYHVLNGIMPPYAEVTYGNLDPWTVPDKPYDLLILGLGNSLLPQDARSAELAELMERVPQSIGIFGTQYRSLFHQGPTREGLQRILSNLTTWWARHEDDIRIFGGGRANVRHLGDWLITAFPMASPSLEKRLRIPDEFGAENLPMDRVIQQIQSYAAVSSGRLHPLLCALTSAKEVEYKEQRIIAGSSEASGKFASMLIDIFGRTFDEGISFPVDRAAVLRYKVKVTANVDELRQQLATLLAPL